MRMLAITVLVLAMTLSTAACGRRNKPAQTQPTVNPTVASTAPATAPTTRPTTPVVPETLPMPETNIPDPNVDDSTMPGMDESTAATGSGETAPGKSKGSDSFNRQGK